MGVLSVISGVVTLGITLRTPIYYTAYVGIAATHYVQMGTRSTEVYTAPIIFTFADPACSSTLGGGADASGLHRRTCGAPSPCRPCYAPPLLSLRLDKPLGYARRSAASRQSSAERHHSGGGEAAAPLRPLCSS